MAAAGDDAEQLAKLEPLMGVTEEAGRVAVSTVDAMRTSWNSRISARSLSV
jgi:hypothetical protein